MRIELTGKEALAVLSALDGFEPDTASYDPEAVNPDGWSPEEVRDLDTAYEKIATIVWGNHGVGGSLDA